MHMVLHRGLYFPQTYFFRVLTYGAENHLAPKPRSHMKSTRPITWTAAAATVLRRSQSPDKFYKGRSQEKTLLLRPEFFLLLSPSDRARSVRTYRAMCSVAGHSGPALWVFSTSGFHRFLATKPVCSDTSKAERGQFWRP